MGLPVAGKLGNKGCTKCKKNPSYELSSCGHTTCYDHYVAAEEGVTVCEYCEKVRFLTFLCSLITIHFTRLSHALAHA